MAISTSDFARLEAEAKEQDGKARSEGKTLKDIRSRGFMNAGVSLGFNGLSARDKDTGSWKGFDIDIARAIASGVLGDCNLVNYVPLQSRQRFSALKNGMIDLGSYNSSITFSREVLNEIKFVHPILFDNEVLLTRIDNLQTRTHKPTLASVRKNRIAAIQGSTTRPNLIQYLEKTGLNFEIALYKSPSEARNAYENSECDLYCLDFYLLAAERALLQDPAHHIFLEDIVAREAMSPAVSNRDNHWETVVAWILKGLITAEELDITSKNINTIRRDRGAPRDRFLNPPRKICKALNLTENFFQNVISQVGNYGEIFEKNLGSESGLGLARKENRLRSRGGLLYAPPM